RPGIGRLPRRVPVLGPLDADGQPDNEPAAAAVPVAEGSDGATVLLDQAPRHGESQTEATLAPVDPARPLDEGIEDARQQIRRDADSRVLADDYDVGARLVHGQLDCAFGFRVLRC